MYLMSCNDCSYLTVHNLDNNFFLMKTALIIIKICYMMPNLHSTVTVHGVMNILSLVS